MSSCTLLDIFLTDILYSCLNYFAQCYTENLNAYPIIEFEIINMLAKQQSPKVPFSNSQICEYVTFNGDEILILESY